MALSGNRIFETGGGERKSLVPDGVPAILGNVEKGEKPNDVLIVGQHAVIVTAFEALSTGNFVNLFSDSGVVKARKADASVTNKPARGFIRQGAKAGETVIIFTGQGINDQLTGLTEGIEYFLSATQPGKVTPTAPINGIVQKLGSAITATQMEVNIDDFIILA